MDSTQNHGGFDPAQRRALDLLINNERFVFAGHVRPDGDCIGAQAALSQVLLAAGKQVTILNPDHPGPQFDYFYDDCPFQVYQAGDPIPEHDVCVLLDINELSRCGALEGPLGAAPSAKLIVDHHPFHGSPWWDEAFVDITASASGVLVWRIARALGFGPNRTFAHAVFTSLVTDTGWFKYSNTDGETMDAAAEQVRAGVQPAQVFSWLYQRNPPEQPGAIAGLLGRLEYFAESRLALVYQSLSDGDTQDADPVLDIVRSVGAVEVVLYLREIEGGACKLSARSKTDYDVSALCRGFGGGGHVKASGATIPGSLSEVRPRVVAAALEAFGAVPVQGAARTASEA